MNKRETILKLLKDKEFVPTPALAHIAKRYDSQLTQLRKEGWVIRHTFQDGEYGYRLIGSIPYNKLKKEVIKR
jgi:hypothetical protein